MSTREPGVRRLVIVGASLAGLRAAESARRTGWDGEIVLVGAEDHLPYDRPPLSKAQLDHRTGDDLVPLRSRDELDGLGVTTLLGTPATGLDTDGRRVLLGDTAVAYDALVIATGATPYRLPGADGIAGVTGLRTHSDAVAVRRALDAGARTVVIGAGFIGSEIASAARKRGLPATIVERLEVPLSRSLGPEPGAICADLHRDAGTDLRLGVGVSGLESTGGRVTGVVLDDGTTVPADLVVVGIGVRPATGWLEDSPVALHDGDRGVLCTASLATSVPGIWAAGDVAHFPNVRFGGDLMRLEHWTNAAEQGALAARNALAGTGEEIAFLDTIPYFWSDWYGHRLQFVGTPRADEVVTVGPHGPGAIVLYRRGTQLAGVLTIDRPRDIMKFRRLVMEPGSWDEALFQAADRVTASA
ncbi:NAD(P)/FAD-dependent oxidoreductase [Nocardioides jiangxiensis]|uniref:FAD-dependent oxidoreductase n=1 Tax=Nocardioides jiangxiensis TaxID=3064524 RepID=A0ABT9AXG9_9ACTN|nr:FAD-dependent oxidoreductase [Nocardioides sp. WY-20]MDO7867237.1 FAD-dependent oxidoreductase [Nocardioides sp. WY-20]